MASTNQKPDGAISLFEAARLTGYHQDYLGQLCRAGKIQAEKIGRVWYTTEDAVRSYFQTSSSQQEQASPAVDSPSAELPTELLESDDNLVEDDASITSLAALREKRDQEHFSNMHLRPAFQVVAAVLISILAVGTFLFAKDSFLGKPNQMQVMNYDAKSKLFRNKSVAGAVDEAVPKIIIYPAPRLLTPQESAQNVLY